MLKILDKTKNIIKGLDRYEDLKIEKKLGLDDRSLGLTVLLDDLNGIVNEGYIETEDDRYVVKEVSPSSNGKATVFCQLDLEALEGKTFLKFESVEQKLADAMALVFAGTGWTVGTCTITKRRTLRKEKCTALDMVKQALSMYRCECVIHSKEQTIDFLEEVGSDRGTYFTSDLNLTELTISKTSYDFYTEIEPYGKDDMTIEEVNSGQKYLTNYSYSSKAKRIIWKDDRYTVPESLKEDAQAKLEMYAVPYVSYQAKVVDLASMSSQYSVLEYDIGDTVTLLDPVTGTQEKQRIVEMTIYPDEPERNECVFANTVLNFEEMASKFNETADTVDNITSDNGTVRGSTIDSIESRQIVDLENTVINYSKIKTLEADVVTVSGNLSAVTADVGTLTANVANFEQAYADQLVADEARFGTIEGNYADLKNAHVDVLEADFANVKSILAGNAAATAADFIQLNATNAVIDSAFLKTLMAQNITVNDLMAGTIYTNRQTIMSEDGALKITGSLIQFKDENGRVRIQEGKDGQGNYSFVLFDANGNAVWYEDGITAEGIPDGILVDDMVADADGSYAGISASKLNIASMVGAINQEGGLRATTIYLDDQAQTLNVAFTQMQNTVSTVSDNASQAMSDASSAVATAANAEATAQNALAVISGISTLDALGASLTNDAHVVHTLTDGTGGNYASAWTKVTVYLGDTDVTYDTVIRVTTSPGIVGTWSASSSVYQVTNLTEDNGYVDFDCLYGTGERYLVSRKGNQYTLGGNRLMINSGGSHIAKRFSISKAPDGRVGVSYDLRLSDVIMTRQAGTSTVVFRPSTITATAVKNDNGTLSNYSGIFVIEESTDGSTYTEKYRSASAEQRKVYTPTQSDQLTSIRVTLYDPTSTYVYDYQTVGVVADADSLSDELDSLAGTVSDVQETVATNSSHISELETSAEGFSQRIGDLETSITGLSDGNLVVNWRHFNNGNNTATVRCYVYKEGHDVADTFPASWFKYVKRDETGQQTIAIGRQVTVNLDDYSYGRTLEGQFMTCDEYYLCTRSGKHLLTRSGNNFTIYKEAV